MNWSNRTTPPAATLDTSESGLHDAHPHWVRVVIEQPRHEPHRVRFDPTRGMFVRTDGRSLPHARGFPGHYGWIQGTGTPPDVHYDVFVADDAHVTPGDVIDAAIVGMFVRADGDHKFFAMTNVKLGEEPDLLTLPDLTRAALLGMYPQLGEGDAWLGRDEARAWLRDRAPEHD